MSAVNLPVSLKRPDVRGWRVTIIRWPLSLKIGLIIIVLVALAGIFAPLLTPYDPIIGDFRNALAPPGWAHPFGTDNLGRDVLSRVLYGARIDLQIGLIATYVPFTYGIALGAIAGYVGGWFDTVLMRLVDIAIAFPFLVVIIVILAILGPGIQNMYIAVFAAGWTIYTRLARAEMLVIREQEYILAARALGYGRFRIIFRHALPNLIQSSIVFSMSDFVLNILLAASLSYFGIGVQPPAPEWGAVITDGRDWLLQAWWISTLPGIAIIITGVGVSLIGDGLSKDSRPAHMMNKADLKGDSAQALLTINDLTIEFQTNAGTIVPNNHVSLWVDQGKTLGIVGESGSGKSVLCRSILRLIPTPPANVVGGEVWFEDRNLLTLSEREMQAVRGVEVGMIFQDPMTGLNPVLQIGDQITESLRVHKGTGKREAREIGIDLLRQVGIPSPQERFNEYPHRLSGGMRQRVVIAMAMACKPKLLLADEPTTALDVTIQDQILALMIQLQEQTGMSIILVSHDMGVVAETTDWVAVMYAGQVMELAQTEAVFSNPKHPYTVGLLNSIPRMEGKVDRLIPMQGQPPNLLKLPKGCPFAERCPVATPDCAETPIALREVAPGHQTACLYPERVS